MRPPGRVATNGTSRVCSPAASRWRILSSACLISAASRTPNTERPSPIQSPAPLRRASPSSNCWARGLSRRMRPSGLHTSTPWVSFDISAASVFFSSSSSAFASRIRVSTSRCRAWKRSAKRLMPAASVRTSAPPQAVKRWPGLLVAISRASSARRRKGATHRLKIRRTSSTVSPRSASSPISGSVPAGSSSTAASSRRSGERLLHIPQPREAQQRQLRQHRRQRDGPSTAGHPPASRNAPAFIVSRGSAPVGPQQALYDETARCINGDRDGGTSDSGERATSDAP